MAKYFKRNGIPGVMIRPADGEPGDKGTSTYLVFDDGDEGSTFIIYGKSNTYTFKSKSLDNCSVNVGDTLIIPHNGFISTCLLLNDASAFEAEEISTIRDGGDFDIYVELSTRIISYDAIDGITTYDENNKKPTLNSIESYAEYLSFTVASVDENKRIGNIRVEAEFIPEIYSGYMKSMRTKLWESGTMDKINLLYPYGFSENYNENTNYDDENLGDFTVVIKNFGEGDNLNKFDSKSVIRKSSIENGIMLIYVYEKDTPITMKKYLIGSIDGRNDL